MHKGRCPAKSQTLKVTASAPEPRDHVLMSIPSVMSSPARSSARLSFDMNARHKLEDRKSK